MITICCISGTRFESLNLVAERYNITPETCRRWIKEGKLPYIIRAGKLAGVYDDTGKRYKSALEMSYLKNIPCRHMMRLIDLDPFGMFRNDWLNPPNGTLTVHYRDDLWWFNDSIPVASIRNGESVTHRKLGYYRHAMESMIEARATGDIVLMGRNLFG